MEQLPVPAPVPEQRQEQELELEAQQIETRLQEQLAEAHAAALSAAETIAALMRERGFPLTRSLRPEEEPADDPR